MNKTVKIALHRSVFEGLCERLLGPPVEIPEYLMLPALEGNVVFYPADLQDKFRTLPLPDPLPPAQALPADSLHPRIMITAVGK